MPRETNSLRSFSAVPFSEKLPTWIQYSEVDAEALGGLDRDVGGDGGLEESLTAPELGSGLEDLVVVVFGEEASGGVDAFSDGCAGVGAVFDGVELLSNSEMGACGVRFSVF